MGEKEELCSVKIVCGGERRTGEVGKRGGERRDGREVEGYIERNFTHRAVCGRASFLYHKIGNIGGGVWTQVLCDLTVNLCE